MLSQLLYGFVLFVGLASLGCTSFASLANTLNDRQVQSCLFYQGMVGPYAHVRGITATGGAPLDVCLKEQ